MSQLRTMSRWIHPGAGLVAWLALGSCGATPVPAGSSSSSGSTGGRSTSMLGGTSTDTGSTTVVPVEGTMPTETNNCGKQNQPVTQGKADVMLILDMSGSMDEKALSGGTRMDVLKTALDQVLPSTDSKIDWGLMVYPGVTVKTVTNRRGGGDTLSISTISSCAPGTVVIDVKENNASAVKGFYSQLSPGGGHTPTAKSIASAVAALQKLSDSNPKFIVLATDGLPNCPEGSQTDNQMTATDAPAAEDAVAAAAKAGIPVFVVGMSISGGDAATATDALNKMADAGGKAVSGGAVKYYAANSAADLVTAMGTIGGQIASCNFMLTTAPKVPDNVLVVYDDHRALPSDTTWKYTDATNKSITIVGDDCTKVMNGTYKNVQVLMGCPGDAQLIP